MYISRVHKPCTFLTDTHAARLDLRRTGMRQQAMEVMNTVVWLFSPWLPPKHFHLYLHLHIHDPSPKDGHPKTERPAKRTTPTELA